MGFFDKTLYLRTFFVILPIGIAITIASLRAIMTPTGLDNLRYTEGVVESFTIGKKYDIATKKKSAAYILKLKDNNEELYRFTRMKPDTMNSCLTAGDTIEVWSVESGLFWQLKSNGRMLLKYKSGSILWFYGLLLFGIGTIFISVLYLVKSWRDVAGGKSIKEKDNGEPKKWTWF